MSIHIKRIIVVVSVALFLILSSQIYLAYRQHVLDVCGLHNHIIMQALREHMEAGGELPQSVDELSKLTYKSGNQKRPLSEIIWDAQKKHDLIYRYEEWNNPYNPVLISRVFGYYVISFSDGTHAVVYSWIAGKQHKSLEY